jgi:hypothetical protein
MGHSDRGRDWYLVRIEVVGLRLVEASIPRLELSARGTSRDEAFRLVKAKAFEKIAQKLRAHELDDHDQVTFEVED